ncbi:hypothetical protein [Nocardia callitridis]|uniref:DUF3040 domain-containing protein n=1 Tax=Nocardia callitridis TaxID=648753 RepID=A0ABP9JTL5_9NOCA
MTSNEHWEIPPLDDAQDITRQSALQPGETLADTRNWAAYVLFGIAFVAVLVTLVAGWSSAVGVAVVFGILAVVTLAGGLGLIALERRRSRADTELDSPGESSAWQVIAREE